MSQKTQGTRYRAAIVGLSGIGQSKPRADIWGYHITLPHSHASAYAQNPRVNVVAICDLVPELLTTYQEQWGEAATYTDYRELLAKEKIDILSVVTPDHLHAQIVVDAAEAGVAGIFCEKPMATSLQDADRMLAAVEGRGVKLSVDYTRRWDPFWQQARMAVSDGRIGELTMMVGHLGGRGATLFRNGCHLIDSMCWFADSPPAWLFGQLESGFEGYTEYQGYGKFDPQQDPGAWAHIQFANGIRAHLDIEKRTLVNYELDLFCTRGRVRISNQEAVVYFQAEKHNVPALSQPLAGTFDYRSGMVKAVDEMVQLLDNGGESVSNGREALRTTEIMIALMRSSAGSMEKVSWPLPR